MESVQPQATSALEALEPRLLLNADFVGMESLRAPDIQPCEQVIQVDLDQQNETTQRADPSLILTYLASPEEPQEVVALQGQEGTDGDLRDDARVVPLHIGDGEILLAGSGEVNLEEWTQATAITVQTVPSALSCPQLRVHVQTGTPVYTEVEGGNLLLVDGCRPSDIPRTPIVPYVPLQVLLPPGMTSDGLTVHVVGAQILDRTYDLAIAPEPVALLPEGTLADGAESAAAVAENSILNPALIGQIAQLVGVQHIRGYTVAALNIYPIQLLADEQVWCSEIEIMLDTQAQATGTWMAPLRESAADAVLVVDMVANPHDLAAYGVPAAAAALSAGPTANATYLASDAPSLLGDGSALALAPGSHDYVIITSAALTPGFLPLVQAKQSRGVDTVIYTLEDISTHYIGVDPAEQVRNFIRDAYVTWGIEYVLLGGDIDVVPHRSVYHEIPMGDLLYTCYDMPADLYFACLDGCWNSNDNSLWGERIDGEEGREVDLLAEVYVGRAPVSNLTEVRTFVRKTIEYETITPPNLTHALWIGGDTSSYGTSDGSGQLERIANEVMPEEYTYTKLYRYAKPGSYTYANIMEGLNNSPHLVANIAHAGFLSLMDLYAIDVDSLTNDYPFLLIADGCQPGAFHRPLGADCIGEHFVLAEHGAFAALLNSYYSWFSPDTAWRFTYSFFDIAFNPPTGESGDFSHRHNHLGVALQLAKQQHLSAAQSNLYWRWDYFNLNLLGDPETPLRQPAFHVNSSALARGEIVDARPLDFAVGFSQAYDPTSVDPADLQINGIAAVSVTLTDPNTIVFHFGTSPVTEQGPQTMGIGAGSIFRAADGSASLPWQWAFYYDILPTVVIGVTPIEGSSLDAPPGEIVLTFNEAINPATVHTDNLVLSRGRVTSATLIGSNTVSYALTGLSSYGEVSYVLKPGAITDVHGTPVGRYHGHFLCADPLLMRWDSRNVPSAALSEHVSVVQSTLDIEDSATIADLDIMVDIGDVCGPNYTVNLIGPDGTRVVLIDYGLERLGAGWDRPCVETIFDNDAPSVFDVRDSQSGHYRPASPLSAFNGLSTQGTWILEIAGDPSNPDWWPSGRINRWALLIHPAASNALPIIDLIAPVTTLPENTDATSRVSIAQIDVVDDGVGTNQLSLSGADALLFEIDDDVLYLKAGTVLDYETKPQLDVTVAVDDPTVGATPDDTAILSITITKAVGSFLRVENWMVRPYGFTSHVNRVLDTSVLNLYDTATAGYGSADVTVVGETVGSIAGSLLVSDDGMSVTFIKTGSPLEADTYTLTFRSADNGFKDTEGHLLDGDQDGVDGGDYVTTMTVAPAASRVVSVPDFARGPGQAVNVPATGSGIPIRISDGTGVQAVDFVLEYDPALLTITGVSLGAGLPADWSIISNLNTPGRVSVTVYGATALSAGEQTLAVLAARVPEESPYASAGVLALSGVQINEGAIEVHADNGIQVVAYLGDATGNHAYSGLDASYIARVSVGLESGFAKYRMEDPVLIGDTTGNGKLSGLDASYMARKAVGLPVASIPELPVSGGEGSAAGHPLRSSSDVTGTAPSPVVQSIDAGPDKGTVAGTGREAQEDADSPLQVEVVTVAPWGLTIRFSSEVDPTVLSLYDTAAAIHGLADITVVGDTLGALAGSILCDDDARTVRFVKTGGPWEPDTYTVTLRSAGNAFRDTTGQLLDGDADGLAGGDYVTTLAVGPSEDRLVSIPDFARGPGQAVNLSATAFGIPVTLDNGSGVQAVELLVKYDPALLIVGGLSLASGLPGDWTLAYDLSVPGQIVVSAQGATALPSGPVELFRIQANIPDGAPYQVATVLEVSGVSINEGAIPARADCAVQVVAYLGDATGNGAYSGLDASYIARVSVDLDRGFRAYPAIDPVIIGDATANGRLSGLDASYVARKAVGLSVPQIPDLAGPTVAISRNAPIAQVTNSQIVVFTLTFDRAVTRVDKADFLLSTTGSLVSAVIASVTGSGALWLVSVDTGSGDGTLGLDVVATRDIQDTAGNLLLITPTEDQAYTLDKTAPSSTIAFPAAGAVYNDVSWIDEIVGTAVDSGGAGLLQVAVSFLQNATGRYWDGLGGFNSPIEVFVPATGMSGWSLAFADSRLPADGAYTLRAKVVDQAGNEDVGSVVAFTYDTDPPTVISKAPESITVNAASTHVDVMFSETVVGVDASDLVLSGPGAAGASVDTSVDLGTHTWRFTVSGLIDGQVSVALAPDAGDICDRAGNALLPTIWSFQVALGMGVSFEDPDLEEAVRRVLQIPFGTPLTAADMLSITSLQVDSNIIDSLAGLEHAANLQSLTMVPTDFSNPGMLSSLSPLSGLTNLDLLVLQRTGLEDSELAPLGSLALLTSLDLRYNQITEVSAVADLPSLSVLRLYGNPIADRGALAGRLIQIDIPPQNLDKADTVEELADALYNLPMKVYEYVLNNVRFEPYAGAMKGATATWETLAGNDWDMALLLAEMLNNAGIATRYVHGRVEAGIDEVMRWLGVLNAEAAADVLANSDISQTLMIGPDGPVSMQFDHTWLEAELALPGEGMRWLALDPSWKFCDPGGEIRDLLTLVPFDEEGYLSETRTELTYEYYESQVAAYLAANAPGVSLADVAYDGPILTQDITCLNGALPYTVVGSTATYSTIPITLTHRVGLRLTGGGGTHFDVTLVMPDTCRQRITISFADAGGGWLHSELRLDGVLYAGSPYDIPSGTAVTLRITHYNADGDSTADRTYNYDRQAGEYIAVGLDAGQISTELLNEQRHDVSDAAIAALNGDPFRRDDRFGAYLAMSVWGYYYETRHAEEVVCGLTGGKALYRRVASGLATSESTVHYFGDLEFPYRPDALSVDLANTVYQGISIDGNQVVEPLRRRIVLHNKSAQEHAIWESVAQTPSMSTIKSLQLASEYGIPIYVIDSAWSESAIRGTLQLSTSTESDIVSRVLYQGETVTVPRQNTPLQDWNGVGYIAERDTGTEWSAAYMITGGLSGGAGETYEGGYISGDPYYWDPLYLDPWGYDVGDPINIANGNVIHEETDFRIPNIGIDLRFARQYNSTVEAEVGFGPGWTHTYSDFLTFNADSSITWTDGGGMNFTFVPDGLGGYEAPTVLHGVTFTESGGQYTCRDKQGLRRVFDSVGRLIQIADRNNNALALSYDGLGRLATVADLYLPSRVLTFTWAGDRLVSVGDFTGRTWTYTHDAAGLLTSVTTPSNAEMPAYTTRYDYYTDTARDGLLKQVTNPDGGVVSYEYYANRRGFEVTDPEGFSHYVHYNVYRRQTIFTDERGFETTHTYNDGGNLIRTRHPDGAIESWTWADSLKTSWTDAFGNTETYEYDPQGNLTRLTDRAGTVTEYVYEPVYSQLTREERFGGRVATFGYDAHGNLIRIADALGNLTTMTYDSRGLLQTVTQPQGNLTPAPADYTTSYAYNGAGQVLTQTTDLPSTLTYTYDLRGNRGGVTDANGNTTLYDYDLLGRLIEITDPLNNDMSMVYDAMGNLVTLTNKLGRTTAYEYDLRQQLLRTILPDGTAVISVRDAAGNVSIAVDESGHSTSYEYDSRNRVIVAQYADGATERTAYDGSGRVVRTIDARGYRTRYVCDALDRRISTTDALGGQSTWTYDAVGNMLTATDPLGNTTTYYYDLLNRVTEAEDALHGVTSYTYDPNGNLAVVTDPLGRTVSYGYDVLDRQITETDGLNNTTITAYDPAGNVIRVTDSLGHETAYVYDALNRMTQVIEEPDTLTYTTTTAYDAVGNVLSITDPESNTTTYVYDARDRVLSETNELGLARRFIYDPAGNLIVATDRNGRVRQFAYDERNRQIAEIWLNEAMQPVHTITRSYDKAGNLLQVSDPAATLVYSYDELGQVVAVDTGCEAEVRHDTTESHNGVLAATDGILNGQYYTDVYTFYAELGDTIRVSMTSAGFDTALWLRSPTTGTLYDNDGGEGTNALIEVTANATGTYTIYATSGPTWTTGAYTLEIVVSGTGLGNVVLEYTYDAAGNRLSVSDNLGGRNEYAYDALNRVASITQSGTDVTDKRVDFAYDAAGQTIAITRYADLVGTAVVATSAYTYDPDVAGRLTALTHANSGGTLAAYTWTFDDAGRIVQMTSADGTSDFDYDDTDQLTAADHSYQADEDYSYDNNGNRTNPGHVTGLNNRLLSDGTYNYAYDNEGNLITRTEIATGAVRRFEWDHRNRLIAVTDEDPSGTPIQRVEFTYDAFDRRIAKSVDTNPQDGVDAPVTYFIYDGEDILIEFVDDDGPSGPNTSEWTMRYIHGPGVDRVLAQNGSGADVRWLFCDRLGTIRDITDEGGTLLNHLEYDTFGDITTQTNPAVTTRHAFTGREYDAEIDLYFYRARYYDASAGRFINEDPLQFDARDTNLYRYVGNQPVLFADARGLCYGSRTTNIDLFLEYINDGHQSTGLITGVGDTRSHAGEGFDLVVHTSTGNPVVDVLFSLPGVQPLVDIAILSMHPELLDTSIAWSAHSRGGMLAATWGLNAMLYGTPGMFGEIGGGFGHGWSEYLYGPSSHSGVYNPGDWIPYLGRTIIWEGGYGEPVVGWGWTISW